MNDTLNEKQIFEALETIYKTQNRDALWIWIKSIFGVEIPRKSICPEHDAPFDFVADVFFQLYPQIIAVANRSGGKTLNFSILDALNMYLHSNCEIATVGAIEDQAKRCYRYFQGWTQQIAIFKQKLIDSLMSMSRFSNNSTLEILTGTIRGVNSPHPQIVFLDEIELMTWIVLQEAFSMAQTKNHIRGQTIVTSTRKFAYGPMERLLTEAEQRGFRIYKWCILEVLEKHDPIECSQTKFGQNECQGRCDQYQGYYSFADTVSKYLNLDADTWDSQWRCKKPSLSGLVYPQFNEFLHVKPIKPDYGMELELAEDFGFAQGHANVIGFFQTTPSGENRMIDEIWVEGKTDEQIVDLVEDKLIELGFVDKRFATDKKAHKIQFTSKVKAWYCPPEEPSKIYIRQQRGYRVIAQTDSEKRKVTFGLPLIRKDFEDMKLFFDIKCKGTIIEMKTYPLDKRSDGTILDVPAKKFDNGPDMVRYFYINKYAGISAGSLTEAMKGSNEEMSGGILDMTF